MNNKAFTISIGLAALAVFMIFSYITSKEEEIKRNFGAEVSVIVAKRDISELSEIHEGMLEAVPRPKKFIEPGRITSIDDAKGFIAAVPIRKGEQITMTKIVPPGVRTGLSKQISPGKRAISIPATDTMSVTRLIKPGDRVDVIATVEPPGAQKGSQIAKMILQDVPVLAVGEYITAQAPRKVERDESTGKDAVRNLNVERSFNTITLEVEPNMAMQISLLRDTGSQLSVLLRNNDDTERVSANGVMLIDVLGQDVSRTIRSPAGGAQR